MNRLGLAVTVVVTVLAGWFGWLYATSDVPAALPVGDRVHAAVDGLRSSNIYVDPDVEGIVTSEEASRIDAAAKAARPEVFIVLWRGSSEAGYYLASQALEQIGEELDRPGYYIVAGPGDISSRDVGIDGEYVSASSVVNDGTGHAEGLLAAIAENDGRHYSEADTTGSDYWGGTGGTIAAGVLFGVLAGSVLAGVLAAGWFIARARRSST